MTVMDVLELMKDHWFALNVAVAYQQDDGSIVVWNDFKIEYSQEHKKLLVILGDHAEIIPK